MVPPLDRIFRRHVHLDFHTSEQLDNIGGAFSRENFQEALKLAHLDGITVFAKCHHSWCYYPTQVGQPHPHLQCDLLGEQIAAAHAVGVRIPIYITVGWSATDAETHPEWLARNRDGSPMLTNYDLAAGPDDKKPICSWKVLCPTGSYFDHLVALTAEIAERYEVDGLFYDICMHGPCYCDNCRALMAAEGLDPDQAADAQRANVLRWTRFMDACNIALHARHPLASVFYNGNAGLNTDPSIWERMTHFELEDLPTTWGGYDKLPLRAKFFSRQGKPLCSMSGKFHTMWGEFGGFKHPDAMKLEGATMIAFGTGASFGDQVHPDGAMDLATYRNIGQALAYVEQLEPLGFHGAVSASNLGLWLCGDNAHDQGVANLLLETQTDFDVVGPEVDLAGCQTIVLPGGRCLTAADAARLASWSAAGGALLVLGESGLLPGGAEFVLPLGARYLGGPAYELDYTHLSGPLASELPDAPFLNYEAALRCEVTGGEALGAVYEPYFNRTYGHYCSHQNTPYRRTPAAHPAAVRLGRTIFLPHALGKLYYLHGARVHRQLFANALAQLHTAPRLQVTMPSAGRVNLLYQAECRRYVAHLLYGPPLQRGRCSVIEDLVPLHDVPVTVRLPQPVRAATLQPQGTALPFTTVDGATRVVVPRVECHQAVVFDLG
ncbi:MAG: hypothetical protein IT204_11075 [Fimbriimonadaceae bacterium]|nr:hypothetical protein [Fimbriimonadaceae bacterium]